MAKIDIPVQVNIPVEEVIEYLKKGGTLVEVVRCKECLYWDEEIKWMPEQFDYICKCVLQDRWTEDDEFCSDGTRKEQNDG